MQLFISHAFMLGKHLPSTAPSQPFPCQVPYLQSVAASSLGAADHLTAGNCPQGCCLLGSSQVPLWDLQWGLVQSCGAAVLSTLPAS